MTGEDGESDDEALPQGDKAIPQGDKPLPQGDKPLTPEELGRVMSGLPHALQVARRVARTTKVLEREDLEAIARLTVPDIVQDFDPERGTWKSFVSARVGFALIRALRKERRCHVLSTEDAVRAGLVHVEGMEPPAQPLAGSDEQAYEQLVETTSEVADVLALHMGATSSRTLDGIHAAIDELAPSERRVATMHFLEHKTFRKIAGEIGSNPSSVFRTYERALAKLRRKLRGPHG